MRNCRCARQRQTSNHCQNGGKRHCRDEAEEQVSAHRIRQMYRRHVVTADKRASSVFIHRVRANEHDRAKADDKGQDVEITHKTGGIEHALTRFAGIADREETH